MSKTKNKSVESKGPQMPHPVLVEEPVQQRPEVPVEKPAIYRFDDFASI